MLGTLKFTTELYTHLTPEMEMVIAEFIAKGTDVAVELGEDSRYTVITVDHPDFVTEGAMHMLYLGNRFNRCTHIMEAKILRLDTIGKNGKLTPIRYY